MEKQNQKTFNLIAETSKGKFPVSITVFEEIYKENEKFTGSNFSMTWKHESFVIINEDVFKIDEYLSDRVRSYEVGKKLNMPSFATLKCDCSTVKDYINKIQIQRIEKCSEADIEIEISKMIHDL